jgi:hypothetical protein
MRKRVDCYEMYENAGFVLVRAKNHNIFRCPCGHTQVSGPCTPGRGRAVPNLKAQINRTLRACAAKLEEKAA